MGEWVLVDVETSGTSARRDRVLSLAAMTLDSSGRVQEEYATLIDADCDPGPVHIHHLTRERLRGAPSFDATLPYLDRMLTGRTLVAHNASFDHGFLVEEARRFGATLPISHRLCTVTLARRLQLNVPNVKLGTLAAYWGIPQASAHDARDDVKTLAEVFRHCVDLANSLGLGLPIVGCAGASRAYPDKVTRVPCPWRDPGRYRSTVGLIQGTKVVITGPTRLPRTELGRRLSDAGLDVMNSISGRTGLVVANQDAPDSRKLQRAAELGITVVDESTVLRLCSDIVAGVLKSAPESIEVVTIIDAPSVEPAPATPVRGPWAGRRVLVMGGSHVEATVMRSRIVQLGAAPAINLTAGVTDVLLLDGGAGDPRMPRVRDRSLTILEMHHIDAALGIGADPAEKRDDADSSQQEWTPAMMPPGAVIDLPAGLMTFTVNVAWTVARAKSPEVDVVAFELGDDERVLSDDEFVFFNQPTSPDGALTLSIDGDCEQGVHVDLQSVPAEVERVTIGAAIEEMTFGELGALSVSVDTPAATVASAVLDAATTERSMIIAEIYRRKTQWRLRMLGQGYDDDLSGFAVRHGVDVEE
ncbi:TerD family protein [Gordonia polyisoprenivorans]|uniref:TerD family protein n=1 Tax=Gordonia polyisoprenivorans TaxID=84595 RepID=UPI001AD7A0CB|nr:TerD family protein [Gordonia polyisoprenivorans]QTI69652.1 TerD family protein [Gordonia polyisoprenivorans]